MEKETMKEGVSKNQETQKPTDKQSIKIKIDKKTAIIIAAVIVLGALVYSAKGLFIVATVDGSPISRLSIISKLEKASGKNLLDSLITEKLVSNEAKAKKVIASNEEITEKIKKIEEQITSQGGTLAEALTGQGMSMDDLKTQIVLQLELEKLVADKTNVTDEEVTKYVADNQITIPAGQEAITTEQIKNEIKNQKTSQEAETLISTLKSQAKINYFVNY